MYEVLQIEYINITALEAICRRQIFIDVLLWLRVIIAFNQLIWVK